jgi:hypothetical protein
MLTNAFQTIAEQLIKTPYTASPISQGSGNALLNAINSPSKKYPDITDVVGGIGDILSAIQDDGSSSDVDKILQALKTANPIDVLSTLLQVPVDIPTIVRGFLTHQLDVAASILSFVNVVQNPIGTLSALESAYGDYFFGGGYASVADQTISPPELPTISTTADLKSLVSSKTGDRYVRDSIRVGIEAVANDLWKLKERYSLIAQTAKIKNADKAKQWFAGFSDYAESAVTAAVEQAAQGVSTFQSNPLIAASLATAAGTAARKAAQVTFLAELGIQA